MNEGAVGFGALGVGEGGFGVTGLAVGGGWKKVCAVAVIGTPATITLTATAHLNTDFIFALLIMPISRTRAAVIDDWPECLPRRYWIADARCSPRSRTLSGDRPLLRALA